MVDDVSLDVRAGEIVGLLGPNGAGKTTTLRMVTGLLRPSEGEVIVCGVDAIRDPLEAKRRLGFRHLETLRNVIKTDPISRMRY